MTTTLPAAPSGAGPRAPDAAEAQIQQQCQRVAGETEPAARKAVLMAAAVALGKEKGVALDVAGPALLAAARASDYPGAIGGQELAAFIRTWLWVGREHITRYGDGARPQPQAPAMAPAPQAPRLAAPEMAATAPTPDALATVPARDALPTVPAPDLAPAEPPPDLVAAAELPATDPDAGPDVIPDDPPVPEPESAPTPVTPPAGDSILLRADALAPEPVDWLWRHHIALGKLTLIGGAPGTGKSTLALGLIAAVSSGGAWPCGEGRAPLGSAILVCEAAGVRDTIIPGLMAAGADRRRIGIISGVAGEGGPRPFDLHSDLAVIEDAIKELGEVRLVVIDPVNAFAGADAGREDRLGALLHPLAALAAKHHVAVVVVAHPPKGNYLKPNVQAIGTVALNAAARTSFLLHNDPIDPRRRLLLQVKNNLSGDRGALSFTIERREVTPGVAGPVVVGEKRRYRITPDDVIGAGAKTRSAKADAQAFLHHLLEKAQSIPVAQIEAEARAAGLLSARQPISQCKPLRDARLALKLHVVREGFGADGRWVWTKEDPREKEEPTAKKPKKTKKEKLTEWRARKVERRAAKAADRARARMEKRASMGNAESMGETSSMAETTSMANATAPAVAEGQL